VLIVARLYWIITAAVLAVAVHAAYMLLAPARAFERNVERIAGEAGRNAFFVIPPVEQNRLFPAFPSSDLFGACAFDVSTAKVALAAQMPKGLWTLTIYSGAGDVIYVLNDRQSGADSFTVTLSLAPSLIEMLQQAGSEDAGGTTGWDVQTAKPKGIAVLWVSIAEPELRPAWEAILRQSSCKAVAS
jgi:uncharacterized membrane protein